MSGNNTGENGMKEEKCTHCKKPLGNSYTFSYGFPNIPREYGCSRFLCKLSRKLRITGRAKSYLKPFVKRLYELVNS